jgi:bifunctional NMN adenylyltransferase/nudix hydrolase
MEKEFDLLVFIGRFQPLHDQHKRVIDIALQKSRHVLVLVGSAGKARTIRNPFTFDERRLMILDSYVDGFKHQIAYRDDYMDDLSKRLIIKPLYDKTYNDAAWVKQVQELVKDTTLDVMNPSGFMASGYNDAKVGLIGASKDNSSYYLKLFPQWKSVNVEIEADVHATTIRESFLEYSCWKPASVPSNVADFMTQFTYTAPYAQLKSELQFVRDYKKQWEVSPYPVKHATVDAVVEQSGHILLVKRKAEPGKGLWALPGGHLNEYEKQLDGAIRELREETKIKVPEAVLRGSIRDHETFDDPYRSTLGRVITKAYHFKLPDDITLPKVKGSDDAIRAKWIPISDLCEDQLFDDHFAIVQYFLGL